METSQCAEMLFSNCLIYQASGFLLLSTFRTLWYGIFTVLTYFSCFIENQNTHKDCSSIFSANLHMETISILSTSHNTYH